MSPRKAGINISYKRSPWPHAIKGIRFLVVASLALFLIISAIKFLGRGQSAKALDFTTHLVSDETAAVGVLGVKTSDIDDDGDIDVITAGKDGLKVYEQKEDGSFASKIIDDKECERVQVIDLDQDGSQDLLVTMLDRQPSVRWYRNTGNIEFSGTNIGTGTKGKAYAGDINADGYPDIVTATTQGGYDIVLERWMNDGSGTFTSTQLSSDSGVTSVTIGDVDGNGYPDIVTGGSNGVQRWNTSDGYSYSRIDIDDNNSGQTHLVVADVNQDNKLDIVAAEPGEDQVIYYRNHDQRSFERIDIGTGLDATTVQVVDLDEDGDEDIVVAAQDDNSIIWLSNNGADSFTKTTLVNELQSVFGVEVSDIDNDNDFDIVTGNHMQGTVYWYERVAAKPVATNPSSIKQSTDGNGIITFSTSISDEDREATSARIQYSTDGTHWHKPWLTSASASHGSVSLENSRGYQVGTTNAIDTDNYDSVKLTLKWDTQSIQNTGGPISPESSNVKLRIIPRDPVGNGDTSVSSSFTVDNKAPVSDNFSLDQTTSSTATLSWDKIEDSGNFSVKIYYGTDATSVLNQTSSYWDGDNDSKLFDENTTTTTITDLTEGVYYTFKLYATDSFGNKTGMPSVNGKTASAVFAPSPTPVTSISPSPLSTPSLSHDPIPTEYPDPFMLPQPFPSLVPATSSPSPSAIYSPAPTLTSPTSENTINMPPSASAGEDIAVNTNNLVILDGTNSSDPDNDKLTYQWRQIKGPEVKLSESQTSTPSFTASHKDSTYEFELTVTDTGGLFSTDQVTVMTKPPAQEIVGETKDYDITIGEKYQLFSPNILSLANKIMLAASLLLITISANNNLPSVAKGKLAGIMALFGKEETQKGDHTITVLNNITGERLAGVNLNIKTMNDKVWGKFETNKQGEVNLAFPVGHYRIELKERDYDYAPSGPTIQKEENSLIYSGGTLHVEKSDQPLNVIIPLKKRVSNLTSFYRKILHVWQFIQHKEHFIAWPIYILGAGINTTLLLWKPELKFLLIEIVYVFIVLLKVWMEMRENPSYGYVRDAITHVPIDLAVVRLYQEGTNRLVMTRATNSQGKFFALPPSGRYSITVSKPGYSTFTKHNIEINKVDNASVKIRAELMPVIPKTNPVEFAFGSQQ